MKGNKWGNYKKYFLTLSLMGALGLNVNWQKDGAKTLLAGFTQLASSGSEYKLVRVIKNNGKSGVYQAVVSREGKEYFLEARRQGVNKTVISFGDYTGDTQAQDCNDCILQKVESEVSFGTNQDALRNILEFVEKNGAFPGSIVINTGNVNKAVSSIIDEKSVSCNELDKTINATLKCGVTKCKEIAKKKSNKIGGKASVLTCYDEEMKDSLDEMWNDLKDEEFDSDSLVDFREKIGNLIETFDSKSASKLREKLARLLTKSFKDPNVSSLQEALEEKNFYKKHHMLNNFINLFRTENNDFISHLDGYSEENLISKKLYSQLYRDDFFCPVNGVAPLELKLNKFSLFHTMRVGSFCDGYTSVVDSGTAAWKGNEYNGRPSKSLGLNTSVNPTLDKGPQSKIILRKSGRNQVNPVNPVNQVNPVNPVNQVNQVNQVIQRGGH